jgi:hypothetical protein
MLLLELLSTGLALHYRSHPPDPEGFVLAGTRYVRDAASDGSDSFFDWLRDGAGGIVGIRVYFPYLPYQALLQHHPGVSAVNHDRQLEIRFRPGAYRPELSGDQDFSNAYVYRSSSGHWALTFPTDWLTHVELASVLALCA